MRTARSQPDSERSRRHSVAELDGLVRRAKRASRLRPIVRPLAASERDRSPRTRDLLLPRLVTGRLDISDIDLGVLDAGGSRVSPRDYSEDELVEQPTLALLERSATRSSTAYTETFGAESRTGLGRDDQSEVVLRHRLRPKLAELNPDLPPQALDAAIEQLVARPLRAGSDVARTRRSTSSCATASRSRSPTTTASRDDRDRARHRLDRRRPNNDFLAVSPALGRRAAAHAPLRHRLLRQRHPAGAHRAEGLAQVGRAGLQRRTCATTATRSRSSSCRTGS